MTANTTTTQQEQRDAMVGTARAKRGQAMAQIGAAGDHAGYKIENALGGIAIQLDRVRGNYAGRRLSPHDVYVAREEAKEMIQRLEGLLMDLRNAARVMHVNNATVQTMNEILACAGIDPEAEERAERAR